MPKQQGSTAPAPAAAPQLVGFRHFLRDPRPDERFRVAGQDPRANDGEARRLLTGLATCMWGNPPPAWPKRLRNDLEPWENPFIPAGYTYFTQLAMHDLVDTADAVATHPAIAVSARNHRVNQFSLDTIYGSGPLGCPHAYAVTMAGQERTRLRLGPINASGAARLRDIGRGRPPAGGDEAQQGSNSEALVADSRNDATPVLAQFTAIFHLLHNAVMERLDAAMPAGVGDASIGTRRRHFAFAREIVGTVFRACVRHDLLRRLLHPAIYSRYMTNPVFIDDKGGGLPLEFSHAAARFGHAMVRPFYHLNDDKEPVILDRLLWLNSKRMPGNFPLDADSVVRWRRFFDLGSKPRPNFSSRIGPQMQRFGAVMPPDINSLADRDLARAATVDLWSVWALRKEIESRAPGTTGLSPLLCDPDKARAQIRDGLSKLAGNSGLSATDIATIAEDPPLAFFVLFEAAQPPNDGKHLGVLGSVILAEVMFGALAAAGTRGVMDIAAQIHGRSTAPFAALAKQIDPIRSVPDLIHFVAQEAKLSKAVPPFI